MVPILGQAKTHLLAEETVAFYYHVLLAGVLAFTLTMMSVLSVRAESGSYFSDDGPWCFFDEASATYSVTCIGFSHSAHGLVHFSCDYKRYHLDWSTWSCTDSFENRWGASP